MDKAKRRQDELVKPKGSLGSLEELSIKICGIKREEFPSLSRKAVITLAGDHGVADQGVTKWPREVTAQMVRNFCLGNAGINVLASHTGCRVVVVDIGVAEDIEPHPHLLSRKVNRGTKDLSQGPAMTYKEAQASIEEGIRIMEELSGGIDIVGTGDMGIGNTTPSAAIASVITGRKVEEVTGRGAGVDDDMLGHKIEVIKRAIHINQPQPHNPLDVLSKVGGFEIGGIAGVILGAAYHHIPVVIDGFISGAGALIATGLCPQVKDYLIASHLSAEPGHKLVLEHLGLPPLLSLQMRLGEGTGAALGIFLCEAATKILSQMKTFSEAGIS
jgi:nicotinate-nucleotide--dimethylbenzimidazole phosphoribosyltransferase